MTRRTLYTTLGVAALGAGAFALTSTDQQAASLALPSCASSDCDCSHFDTHQEAQAFFERAGAGDPHRLDRDDDGEACETLP